MEMSFISNSSARLYLPVHPLLGPYIRHHHRRAWVYVVSGLEVGRHLVVQELVQALDVLDSDTFYTNHKTLH